MSFASGRRHDAAGNTRDLPYRVWGGAAQPVEFGYDAVAQRTTMTT